MNVYQLLPNFMLGDGIGNEVLVIDEILKEYGVNTKVFADGIDPHVPEDIASAVCTMPQLAESDIVLYHLSIGSDLNKLVSALPCRKIFMYHNITPAHFFKSNPLLEELCKRGEQEVKELCTVPDYCMADSKYNKQDLINNGYTCKIDVIPILLNLKLFDITPSQKIIQNYSDDWTNLIFVGRIAPNKKQDDVIKAYAEYKKKYNQKSRLFIVGSYWSEDDYYRSLIRLVEENNINDVIFTGHVSLEEEIAYYKLAHVFICMSEHEGFCIPLLESMYYDLPIVAYAAAAVPDTVGQAGYILEDKTPENVAAIINKAITEDDENWRKRRKIQLQQYDYELIKEKFVNGLFEFANRRE